MPLVSVEGPSISPSSSLWLDLVSDLDLDMVHTLSSVQDEAASFSLVKLDLARQGISKCTVRVRLRRTYACTTREGCTSALACMLLAWAWA